MWRRVVWALLSTGLAVVITGGVAAAEGHPFSTPGYHWNHKLPKVAPVIPGKLVKIDDGTEPRVLVDAAGTGQIAYNVTPTNVSEPSVLHDCVLKRGQTGCASNAGLIPPETGNPQAISFGSAPGAAYYLLTVRGSDGRHLLRVIRGRHHSLTLPYLGYTDRLTVTVTGVSSLGKRGRAVSKRV